MKQKSAKGLAKDLRIGEPFGQSRDKNGDRPRIKVIHELCAERPTPHVHIVTNEGTHCRAFNARVS